MPPGSERDMNFHPSCLTVPLSEGTNRCPSYGSRTTISCIHDIRQSPGSVSISRAQTSSHWPSSGRVDSCMNSGNNDDIKRLGSQIRSKDSETDVRVQDEGYYGYISIMKSFGYALGYEAKSRELCMPILGFQKSSHW